MLDRICPVGDELVAQHVEADFVDRRVHNVRFVCFSTLIRGHRLRDRRHRQAEKFHQRTHPFRIPGRQVVVHGDRMHPLAHQPEPGVCHGPHQGFALTGGHLDHVAFQQAQHRLELHGKRGHPQGSGGGYG